jgi:MFS transporter, DHA1 family, inner membrane transport protein
MTGVVPAEIKYGASRTAALTLSVLVCAAAAYQLALSIVNPLLLEIARDFRIPLALAAQARTIQAAAAGAMSLVAIFVADRIPRRLQLVYGLAGQGLAALALAAAHSFGVWLVCQAASGAAAGLVGLAGAAAVGDYFPEARRGFAMAWLATGYAIAFLAGLPLAGWLATTWGWRSAYLWAAAGSSLLALTSVLAGLPAYRPARAVAPRALSGWRQMLVEPASRGWLAGELLTMTGWSGFLLYVGPFFGVTYGLRPHEISLVLAVLSVVGIFGIRISVPWGKHWGTRRVLVASTLLAAAAILAPFSLRLSPLFSLLAVAPFTFLGALRLPTSSTIGLALLPDTRGTMMAARGLTVSVAAMLAALTGGIVLTMSGFRGLGPWWAVLMGAGCALYWRGIPAETVRSGSA